jgi:hypothetical protein
MSIKKQICSIFVFAFVFGIFFVSIPDLSFAGCCQNNNNPQCSPGQSQQDCNQQQTFDPNEDCVGAPPHCVATPPPGEGCCAFPDSPVDCQIATQEECENGQGSYFGDGTLCEEFPAECAGFPPEDIGCCIFPDFICIEDTGEGCEKRGGEFQGLETQCSEFPDQCIPPVVVTDIPTLSEMGLVVAVVLFGLAGILVARKRLGHKTK